MRFSIRRKALSRSRIDRLVSLSSLVCSAALLVFVALMLDDVRKEERKLSYLRGEIVSMQASMFLGCQAPDRGREVFLQGPDALDALARSAPVDLKI